MKQISWKFRRIKLLKYLKIDNYKGGIIMAYVLECNKLSKNYKKAEALKELSLNLEENKIYGFLGRNGAGKTTFLNIVSGQVFNSAGEIKVFGEKHFENDNILNKICFIKDRMIYMSNFKVKKIFELASDFFQNWDEKFKNELVAKFKLDINKKYTTLSKGTAAIVGIIIGLASRSELTIYDEAYLGLDAAARKLFYDILLEDYLENPRTIIFSTHLIDEVSNLFEEIIILHNGKILLKEETDIIKNKSFVLTGTSEIVDKVADGKNIIKEQQIGKSKQIYIFDELKAEEVQSMNNKGIDVKPMSLQDMFINITED